MTCRGSTSFTASSDSRGRLMGQYRCHVFVCTSGDTCPQQGDVEKFVKVLRAGAIQAGKQVEVRVNKAGCFSQCGHGPMIVVYRRTCGTAACRSPISRRSSSLTSWEAAPSNA